MLQRVMMDGIELPRLYIAENREDAKLAMSKGIPFIRWTQGQDALIRILLRPVLEQMFPHIRWSRVLGRKRKFRTNIEICEPIGVEEDDDGEETHTEQLSQVIDDTELPVELDMMHTPDEDGMLTETADIASSERIFDCGSRMQVVHKLSLEEYAGDLSSCVDLEVLQRLRLMPAFIGDILDCVKINVGSGMHWREGYNKRLGIPVGRFDSSSQLPNLIILDVSASIPRGISATMISLVDTLRTQLSADLIITSANSRFYPMGSELPDPQRIRDIFGYGNESKEFNAILSTNIRGRHYGHVISFGDNDTPTYDGGYRGSRVNLEGTIVEHVHHYHTGCWAEPRPKTGYAKWCHMLAKPPLEEYDTSWCKVIKS